MNINFFSNGSNSSLQQNWFQVFQRQRAYWLNPRGDSYEDFVAWHATTTLIDLLSTYVARPNTLEGAAQMWKKIAQTTACLCFEAYENLSDSTIFSIIHFLSAIEFYSPFAAQCTQNIPNFSLQRNQMLSVLNALLRNQNLRNVFEEVSVRQSQPEFIERSAAILRVLGLSPMEWHIAILQSLFTPHFHRAESIFYAMHSLIVAEIFNHPDLLARQHLNMLSMDANRNFFAGKFMDKVATCPGTIFGNYVAVGRLINRLNFGTDESFLIYIESLNDLFLASIIEHIDHSRRSMDTLYFDASFIDFYFNTNLIDALKLLALPNRPFNLSDLDIPFAFNHAINASNHRFVSFIDGDGIQLIYLAYIFTANDLQELQRQARYLLNQSLLMGSVRTQAVPIDDPTDPHVIIERIENIDLQKLCSLDFTSEVGFVNGAPCSVTGCPGRRFAIIGLRNWVTEELLEETNPATGEACHLAIFYEPTTNGFIFATLRADGSGDRNQFNFVMSDPFDIGALIWTYEAGLLLRNADDDAINGTFR